jgi:DNA-directed RNA polymerase specialized sigma24 family protein
LLRALVIEEIETVLADLPEEQREVFEMTELLDYSVKETAENPYASQHRSFAGTFAYI